MLKTILNRPVAVVTVFTVAVLVSLLMVVGIPLDMFPQLDIPVLAVTAAYPGAGPEEVEEEVTRRLESEISGLEGLDSMTSTSYENMSVVILSFDFGVDINEKQAEVRSRLDRVRGSLPSEVEDPVLQKFDPSSLPILTLTLSGDRTEKDTYRIAEDVVSPTLEAIEGVAGVTIEGERESIIQIDVDQESLEAYGLSLSQLSQVLSAQNMQLGAGSFDELGKDILIHTSGRYSSLEEIQKTVVTTLPGHQGGAGVPLLLEDLATVSWGYQDAESLVRINGERGLSLEVRKGADANSVAIADAVRAALPKVNDKLPEGMELSMLTDSTSDVRKNLSQVGSAAVLGVVFAVLVLLLFLRQVRSTLIVGLSIPIALAITVAGLAAAGKTLNVVTLVGLAMGVGMIVDSSIVIIENIYRYRMKGAPMKVAAFRGAGEMMAPIVASTLTTIAVYLPLVMYKNDLGFIGIFFGELAYVIILSLTASLAVAALLVPVLSSHFLPIQTREEKPMKSRFLQKIDGGLEAVFIGMENGFAHMMRFLLHKKGWVLAGTALVCVLTVVLAREIPMAMMPPEVETSVNLKATFPTGTNLTEVDQVMAQAQGTVMKEVPSYDRVVVNSSKGSGSIQVTFPSNDSKKSLVLKTKESLREFFLNYPGVNISFESSNQGMGSSGVDVSITGTDWDAMTRTADAVAAVMRKTTGIAEVKNDAQKGLPRADIVFDRKALYEQGLNIRTVAAEVRALTAGTTATEFSDDGQTYDIVLRLEAQDRASLEDLDRLFVLNSKGEKVSLARVATIERGSGPSTISREDQKRTIHVIGALEDGMPASEATAAVRSVLTKNIPLEAGVEWSIGGEMDDFAETGTTMLLVMAIAALLVVAVMVAQFESFRDPLAIALALPLMGVGVVGILRMSGMALSMVSMMGIVMLLGIVVNNGIVLVDHARLMRRRGMSVVEACVESCRSRLRPVLMTTLTTILAMIPMAFFPGEGGETMQPMGVAVVGGLTTSTIGTLILVPVLYALFHRKHEAGYISRKEQKRLAQKNEEVMA